MKIIKKNYKILIGFMLGIVVSAITVYAGTLMNSNEVNFTPKNNKWNVTNVDEALNSLYSVAVPEEYTGTTTITPTYSDITLNTQDKLLKNNITISGIPSTYKNLTSTTTITTADLATGKTAYNSDGNLITGTGIVGGSNCTSGIYNHSANTQWNISIGFVPKRFFLSYVYSGYKTIYTTYDSTNNDNIYYVATKTNGSIAGSTIPYIQLSGTNIVTNLTSSTDLNSAFYKEAYEVSYMACK